MTDPDYETISDYVDVEAHNAFASLMETGRSEREAFAIVHGKARDNARTPMQWDSGRTAGFTNGTPWLRSTNQARINVADEEAEGRILPYYRRLIALRKAQPVISPGTLPTLRHGSPRSLRLYTRAWWPKAARFDEFPRQTSRD